MLVVLIGLIALLWLVSLALAARWGGVAARSYEAGSVEEGCKQCEAVKDSVLRWYRHYVWCFNDMEEDRENGRYPDPKDVMYNQMTACYYGKAEAYGGILYSDFGLELSDRFFCENISGFDYKGDD